MCPERFLCTVLYNNPKDDPGIANKDLTIGCKSTLTFFIKPIFPSGPHPDPQAASFPIFGLSAVANCPWMTWMRCGMGEIAFCPFIDLWAE